ncbi:MAG: hypothetical protein RDU25_00070 [Patescibacteria group bacterium]|nr:hypothetical protein [Patescibacteria group bacterium]
MTIPDEAASAADSTNEPREPNGRRNPDPGPAYREAFTDDVKRAIVRATQEAYEIVRERHDEELGFNANTFGYNVYHVGKYQLEKYCKRTGGKLERVDELKTLFRVQGGGYTVGFYKVGSTAGNIWESFPTSENGAMSVNDQGQPILLGLEDAMVDSVEDLRYAVVAHMGNPRDGLCAVYICIPIQTEFGKIKRWGFAEEIYKLDREAVGPIPPQPSALPPETPAVPIVPEEPETEIVVTAK